MRYDSTGFEDVPRIRRALQDISHLPTCRVRRNIDVIPLCSGCLGQCTYCQTLHARGRLRSYPADAIIKRLSEGIAGGEITEFWFTGEDTLAWGQESGLDFAELFKKILPLLEGTSIMVRIGMTDPESVIGREEKLVEVMRNPHVYKFLHLPVQSASDTVLSAMKRRYLFQQYRELIARLRIGVPVLAIATDYIVGFPGETDEDHRMSLCSIEELNFDVVNVTQYYPRPNTPAALMQQIQ